MKILLAVPMLLALPLLAQPRPARDASQAIDEEYTKKIREYTTEPFFNSPLTDYLPASKTVPTPKAVLGDVADDADALARLSNITIADAEIVGMSGATRRTS